MMWPLGRTEIKWMKAMSLRAMPPTSGSITRGGLPFQRLGKPGSPICGRSRPGVAAKKRRSVEACPQVPRHQRYTGTTVGRPHRLTSIETMLDNSLTLRISLTAPMVATSRSVTRSVTTPMKILVLVICFSFLSKHYPIWAKCALFYFTLQH